MTHRSRSFIKRASERVPSSLLVKFPHDGSISYGIVTNISKKGMCIRSGTSLPVNAKVKLIIPLKNDNLSISAEIIWSENTNEFYDAMGVEISKPSGKYLRIVDSFMTSQ